MLILSPDIRRAFTGPLVLLLFIKVQRSHRLVSYLTTLALSCVWLLDAVYQYFMPILSPIYVTNKFNLIDLLETAEDKKEFAGGKGWPQVHLPKKQTPYLPSYLFTEACTTNWSLTQ